MNISTAKFNKARHVRIDEISMVFKAPGSRSELAFSQMQRRYQVLEKKVNDQTITEQELDRLDKLEEEMFGYFSEIITGDGESDSQVKQWLDDTPMSVIHATIEELKTQLEDKDKQEKQSDEVSKAEENGQVQA